MIRHISVSSRHRDYSPTRAYVPDKVEAGLVERIRERFERLRCRYLYTPMDAVLTLRSGAAADLQTLSSPGPAGSRSYRRVQRLAKRAAVMAPNSYTRLQKALLSPAQMPFRFDTADLLNFGSGSTVFRLARNGEESNGQWVMKVFRRSLGRGIDELVRQANDRRESYELIRRWYGRSRVVLPTHFLVLHNPLLSLPALACIQPLVRGRRVELPNDFAKPEFIQMLRTHPQLRAQFVDFTERTLRAAREEEACIDLVGDDNLMLIPEGSTFRLVLLDYGIYRFAVKEIRHPRALHKIRCRLADLERFLHQVDRLPALAEPTAPAGGSHALPSSI